jgi:hypothetical protein
VVIRRGPRAVLNFRHWQRSSTAAECATGVDMSTVLQFSYSSSDHRSGKTIYLCFLTH